LMKEILVSIASYDAARFAEDENRFLIGNGYLGVRGALEEYRKEHTPAVNLAGLYDRFGDGWREPVNAPNPFYCRVSAYGAALWLPDAEPLSHCQSLDILTGLHSRRTVFAVGNSAVTLSSERFAHMSDPHLLGVRVRLTSAATLALTIEAGIDSQVWDIHGPHFREFTVQTHGECLTVLGVTNEGDQVCTAWRGSFSQAGNEAPLAGDGIFGKRCQLTLIPGEPIVLSVRASVFTSLDCDDPQARALQAVRDPVSWEEMVQSHRDCWQALWEKAFVTIEGDDTAQLALNYSIYHLLSIAPRHHASRSIPARGLSGQTYKGAIFWDTEMFMLDFYLAVLPGTARTILQYRIDTLEGAMQKAASYGYKGAFYAWESQNSGEDACSDYNVTDVFTGRPMRTWFRDKQVHISSAIVYGLLNYTDWTGDDSLLLSGGMQVLVEVARFYHSLLLRRADEDCLEIHDVIGPDEYHERVNNNAYTNEMARLSLMNASLRLKWLQSANPEAYDELASCFGGKASLKDLEAQFLADAQAIREPRRRDGVIEQFDGYFSLEDASIAEVRGRLMHEKEYWGGAYGVASHTQVIKQADVIALLCMRPEIATPDDWVANYNYYLPRTEHGSSLSACMYALAACRVNQVEEVAYPLFLKSASADLAGGGKAWAGLVYIGGTHPAAAGGAFMVLLRGFLGLGRKEGRLTLAPALPAAWKRLKLNLCYRGKWRTVDVKEGRNLDKAFIAI